MYEHKIFTQGTIWGINSFGPSPLPRPHVLAHPQETDSLPSCAAQQTRWVSSSARSSPRTSSLSSARPRPSRATTRRCVRTASAYYPHCLTTADAAWLFPRRRPASSTTTSPTASERLAVKGNRQAGGRRTRTREPLLESPSARLFLYCSSRFMRRHCHFANDACRPSRGEGSEP
jgi:hypothetical protein